MRTCRSHIRCRCDDANAGGDVGNGVGSSDGGLCLVSEMFLFFWVFAVTDVMDALLATAMTGVKGGLN